VAVPDQTQAVMSIAACAGPVAIIGPATSAQTGSNATCTDGGCYLGAPLPVPNAMTVPTSICIVQTISTAISGSVDCSTGATTLSLPLDSSVFLTGDKLSTIAGIQPCPLCSSGTCIGGPNNGLACTPGTSTLGGNVAYPTSHDCPPAASDLIVGSVPIAFGLSSGTVTWSGTVATNDTGDTASTQVRVFSGFCRDLALPGGTAQFKDPAQKCWENGMAVGPACGLSDTFESCEQRTNGAFGPNGGGNRTITAMGNATSVLGGPAGATLVSVFSIPPSFDATIDSAYDLAGPGALALHGTLQTCPAANPCP
jgi:hypothetical protein